MNKPITKEELTPLKKAIAEMAEAVKKLQATIERTK